MTYKNHQEIEITDDVGNQPEEEVEYHESDEERVVISDEVAGPDQKLREATIAELEDQEQSKVTDEMTNDKNDK